MADDRMPLLELAEKHADGDFLRELGQYVLQRLMELEARQRCGAGLHERSPERVNQRNGYRERKLETRIGAIELRGAQRIDQARDATLQSAWRIGLDARGQIRRTAARLRRPQPRLDADPDSPAHNPRGSRAPDSLHRRR